MDTSTILVSICRSLESETQDETMTLISKLTKAEEKTDSVFEITAEKIMTVEFLNINPDYLLDITKYIDEISDLMERGALLFQYLGKLLARDLTELLVDAAIQIQKITLEVVECLGRLRSGSGGVREICELLSEREKAVDALREEFNSHVVLGETTLDQKILAERHFWKF